MTAITTLARMGARFEITDEWITDAEMAGMDLSAWRTALNGAESVAPSVLRAFSDRFARWGFRAEAMRHPGSIW